MTHLRKGLAAAETVDLHLVEAGDLHCGAEERRPARQSGRSRRGARELQLQALRRAALADDARPAPGSAPVPELRERPSAAPAARGAPATPMRGGPETALPARSVRSGCQPLGSPRQPKCRGPGQG